MQVSWKLWTISGKTGVVEEGVFHRQIGRMGFAPGRSDTGNLHP
jgi:hypothetical protein